MTPFEAILLGIVQGLTEFLPVSSSGHLVLGEALLGTSTPGVLFEVAVHVATLCAVCIVFRERLLRLVGGVLRRESSALVYVGLLLLATVPAAIVGTTLSGWIEPLFDRPLTAATLILVTGGIVWSLRRTVEGAVRAVPSAGQAFLIGVAQAVAILPGISRSGTTVAVGTWLGVDPTRVAEFSFLMSIPAIAGAAVLQVPDLRAGGMEIGAVPLLVAFAAAVVSGILAIRIFVRMLERRTFHRFAYYCWVAGAAYLVAAWLVPGLR